jgi:hypothetical protein
MTTSKRALIFQVSQLKKFIKEYDISDELSDRLYSDIQDTCAKILSAHVIRETTTRRG